MTRDSKKVLWLVALSFTWPAMTHAHHGLDFLLVQTAHLPETSAAYAIGRLDYIDAGEYEMEFEPAVLYGVTDWITLEVHAHFEKEEGLSTEYESVAPALFFRLSPRTSPFSAGVSVEYEIAGDSDDEDVAELGAMFAYTRSDWMLAANVVYEKPSGVSGDWVFAAGVRRSLRPGHALGMELERELDGANDAEALLGYYGELSRRFSINAGVGFGVDGGPDWTFRSALIWQFR